MAKSSRLREPTGKDFLKINLQKFFEESRQKHRVKKLFIHGFSCGFFSGFVCNLIGLVRNKKIRTNLLIQELSSWKHVPIKSILKHIHIHVHVMIFNGEWQSFNAWSHQHFKQQNSVVKSINFHQSILCFPHGVGVKFNWDTPIHTADPYSNKVMVLTFEGLKKAIIAY